MTSWMVHSSSVFRNSATREQMELAMRGSSSPARSSTMDWASSSRTSAAVFGAASGFRLSGLNRARRDRLYRLIRRLYRNASRTISRHSRQAHHKAYPPYSLPNISFALPLVLRFLKLTASSVCTARRTPALDFAPNCTQVFWKESR